MASYGLEAVNEPLEEAAIQLSLDSLRDQKTHLLFEFFKSEMHLSRVYLPYNQQSLENWWRISSTLICPIQKTYGWIFWNAGNRQAIDGHDDSECNSRMLREGSYQFSVDPGKHTLCTWWRKLFQYEHFYEHLMWQERITNNNWQFSPDVDNFTCAKARH